MSNSLTLSVARGLVNDSVVFHKVCIGRLSCIVAVFEERDREGKESSGVCYESV